MFLAVLYTGNEPVLIKTQSLSILRKMPLCGQEKGSVFSIENQDRINGIIAGGYTYRINIQMEFLTLDLCWKRMHLGKL